MKQNVYFQSDIFKNLKWNRNDFEALDECNVIMNEGNVK